MRSARDVVTKSNANDDPILNNSIVTARLLVQRPLDSLGKSAISPRNNNGGRI